MSTPYRIVFDHVLRRLDPEFCHEVVMGALSAAERVPGGLAITRALFGESPSAMPTRRPTASAQPTGNAQSIHPLGLGDANPFGLAAGFDKDARAPLALLALGFGHVEVGTITARPQPGNPRPRSFRLLADRALINRMGFNNGGADAAARRLARVRRTERGQRAIIGVNIGKTKTTALEDAAEDYRYSARTLAPYASYLAVNVSSPNTPGLRDLQSVTALTPILTAVQEEAQRAEKRLGRRIPVLVKIAPDLHDDDILAVARMVQEIGLDGIIATNTTIARPTNLHTDRARIEQIGAGGLSGPILARRSREVLHLLRDALPKQVAIVSCGGITTPEEARARLDAGADLVQGYTAMIYEGPSWPGRIARALSATS